MSYSAMTNLATGALVTEAEWDKIKGNFDDLHARTTPSAASVATSQTTASTSYTDLATSGPSVTVTTGTLALVIVGATLLNDTAGDGALMSFGVTGATTSAAADARSFGTVIAAAGHALIGSRVYLITLTAGSNVFTAKYRASVGGTASFQDRQIVVIPLAGL